jgi:hypothetical protein
VGKDTQLLKQVGEYLVAAELARRGFLCATFAGNVRFYDIIASGPSGTHVPVQVKASGSGNWQFDDARDFAEIRTLDDNTQDVGHAKPQAYPGLVFVFVAVTSYGADQFFIIDWDSLCSLVISHYKAHLEKHDGRRPKNPASYHAAISVAELSPFKDRWDIIVSRLGHAA